MAAAFACALVVILFAVLGWRAWAHRRAQLSASRLLQTTMTVWAAAGPFSTGNDSARAMNRGLLARLAATGNLQEYVRLRATAEKHAEAFDIDPAGWEATRSTALSNPDQNAAKLAEVIPMWAWSPERFDGRGAGGTSLAFLCGAMIAADLDWPYLSQVLDRWSEHPKQYDADPEPWEALRARVRAECPLTEEQEERRRAGVQKSRDLLMAKAKQVT